MLGMMQMSQKEAYDQEKAAVHEAGHLVVARHVFANNFMSIGHLKAQIYSVPGGTRSGCTWNGDFIVHGLDLLPPEERAKIGVAGVIAVTRWRGTSVQDLDFKESRHDVPMRLEHMRLRAWQIVRSTD